MRNDAGDVNNGLDGRRDEAIYDEGQISDEAMSQGRDVRDTSREGATHGTDVLSEEIPEEIEDTGRTVVDRSRIAETRGVDVIDLGPVDEPRDDESDDDKS